MFFSKVAGCRRSATLLKLTLLHMRFFHFFRRLMVPNHKTHHIIWVFIVLAMYSFAKMKQFFFTYFTWKGFQKT